MEVSVSYSGRGIKINYKTVCLEVQGRGVFLDNKYIGGRFQKALIDGNIWTL